MERSHEGRGELALDLRQFGSVCPGGTVIIMRLLFHRKGRKGRLSKVSRPFIQLCQTLSKSVPH